jgi:hypothetical protein
MKPWHAPVSLALAEQVAEKRRARRAAWWRVGVVALAGALATIGCGRLVGG